MYYIIDSQNNILFECDHWINAYMKLGVLLKTKKDIKIHWGNDTSTSI